MYYSIEVQPRIVICKPHGWQSQALNRRETTHELSFHLSHYY